MANVVDNYGVDKIEHLETREAMRTRIQAYLGSDDTNGIEFVEQEDGSVKLLFDLQGRQLKDGVRSQMFIENGQKKFNR